MPRWLSIGLWIVGITSLVIAGVGSLFYFGLDGMCANEQLFDLPSPDGALKAVVFQRDCGATTDFSTQVSIVGASRSLPNRGGNLFVADTDHGRAPSGIGGGPEVRVAWRSSHSLQIARHRDARVFLEEPGISGVTAEYVVFQ